MDQFRAMQECMQKYPDLYPHEDDDEDEKESQALEATTPPVAREEKEGSS